MMWKIIRVTTSSSSDRRGIQLVASHGDGCCGLHRIGHAPSAGAGCVPVRRTRKISDATPVAAAISTVTSP